MRKQLIAINTRSQEVWITINADKEGNVFQEVADWEGVEEL